MIRISNYFWNINNITLALLTSLLVLDVGISAYSDTLIILSSLKRIMIILLIVFATLNYMVYKDLFRFFLSLFFLIILTIALYVGMSSLTTKKYIMDILPITYKSWIFLYATASIKHYDKTEKYLNSLKMLALLLVLFIFVVNGGNVSYYALSNCLFIPASYIIYYGLKNKKKHYQITGAVLSIIIFIFGTRLSAIFLFFEFLYLLYRLGNVRITKKTIFITILLIILGLNASNILLIIDNVLDMLHIESRTFEKIITGDLFADARFEMWGILFNKVAKNPFGYGVGMDAVFLYKEYFVNFTGETNNLSGMHAHNGMLEMAIEFGVIPAFSFFSLLAIWGIRKLQRIAIENEFFLFFLLFFWGYVYVLIDNRYWTNTYFFMFIGILISMFRRKKCADRN